MKIAVTQQCLKELNKSPPPLSLFILSKVIKFVKQNLIAKKFRRQKMYCEKPRILIRDTNGKLKPPLTHLDKVLYETSFINIPYTPNNEKNKPATMQNVVRVPCGHCLFCRAEQRREWGLRCWLEEKEYDSNLFITLTYDDKHLPKDGVNKVELSKFMHTLREYFRREHKHSGIRFYACGEYGNSKRAHYHILLFNCPPFKDIKFFKKNDYEQDLYISKILDRLWGKGGCIIGAVTRQSCDYVARFNLKNFGTKLSKHLNPQFQSMSNQNGIGLNYLLRNFNDIIANDEIKLTGSITERLPRYYDRKIAEIIGTERFEKEIAKPRREKAIAFISAEIARTGLSEEEIYLRRMKQEKDKIEEWINKEKIK